MLRLSRVLILTLLVVTISSTAAFATTSRVAALAGAASYINDDSDVFRWYGVLPSYSNMVMAEVGQVSLSGSVVGTDISVARQALGFTMEFSEGSGTWGFYLLHNNLDDMSFYLFNPLARFGTLRNQTTSQLIAGDVMLPPQKVVIQWGKEFNAIALGISFSRSQHELENANGSHDLSFTQLGGGIRWDIDDNRYLDAVIDWGNAGGDTLGGFDNSNAWNIEARVFNEDFEDMTLVGYFGWQFWKWDLVGGSGPSPTPVSPGDDAYDITIGLSGDFDVNANNLLIAAVEVEWSNWKPGNLPQPIPAGSPQDTEIKQQTLPRFYVALESDITSWLTTRVGATNTLIKTETTTDDGSGASVTFEEKLSTAEFTWHLGAGFHLAEWDIDLLVAEETPFRLGYWLTGFGASVETAPVTRISATYRF